MKKHRLAKKPLALKTETVRQLDRQLVQVTGGLRSTPTNSPSDEEPICMTGVPTSG